MVYRAVRWHEGREEAQSASTQSTTDTTFLHAVKTRKEEAGATGMMLLASGGSSPPGSGSNGWGSADGSKNRKAHHRNGFC